jgi:hypothetical protein
MLLQGLDRPLEVFAGRMFEKQFLSG